MYLITEKYIKPYRGVPRYHCQVFYINSNNLLGKLDVTDQVAKRFDFKLKKNFIIIYHGSGTGFGRIKEALKSGDKNIIVHDVSFYNY